MNYCKNQKLLTSAIFAGGKSSRFGSAKAYARLHKRSLIEHAVHNAQQIAETIIIIAAEKTQYSHLNLPVFADIIPDCGPMGGLFTALSHADTPFVATFSCDLPLLQPEIYLILIEQQVANKPVVAVSHYGVEPLIAIWPVTSAHFVENAIRNNQLKLYHFLKQMQAVEVFIPGLVSGYEQKWFVNINTPTDLKKIEE